MLIRYDIRVHHATQPLSVRNGPESKSTINAPFMCALFETFIWYIPEVLMVFHTGGRLSWCRTTTQATS